MTRAPIVPGKTQLEHLLKQHGPCLSTELIERLRADGVSHAAARQRIARGLKDADVKRLAGLRFQHNARFLYLADQFGTVAYWTALERAFAQAGQAYWRAVVGLRARGGILPRPLFDVACGAPANRKGQLSPARILQRLCEINLLKVKTLEDGVDYVTFEPLFFSSDPIERVRARLLAEAVALEGVREWVRRFNFGSFHQVRTRNDEVVPEVSSAHWDLSAPSYVRPVAIRSGSAIKNGFFVADILMRSPVGTELVEAYLGKCDLAAAPLRTPPIMAMLVVDSFAQEALTLARGRGLVVGTIAQLLGDEIARSLRDFVEMLTDLGASVAADPGRLDRVLKSLTSIRGAAANVRASLFELAVGYVAREVEGGYFKAGVKVQDAVYGSTADIDVLLDRPNGSPVLVIECKAKEGGSRVSLQDVTRWRENRIPLIRSALERDNRFAGRPLEFQLWTNGEIHPAALDYLRAQPALEAPHSWGWKSRSALKEYVRGAGTNVISKIMDEHYFADALTRSMSGATRNGAQGDTNQQSASEQSRGATPSPAGDSEQDMPNRP